MEGESVSLSFHVRHTFMSANQIGYIVSDLKNLSVVKSRAHKHEPLDQQPTNPVEKPSQQDAEAAVRTLIAWAGDDPAREGLLETPNRVVRAYGEFFRGYELDPRDYLAKTFEETDGYDEIVLLKDIRFESHCEHHMVPFIGKAHVAYLPNRRVVGISKLARVVDAFSKRLQIQEKMTSQIANTIDEVLEPRGVAVVVEAAHQCMTMRGVHKSGVSLVTSRLLGAFREDPSTRREFLAMVDHSGGSYN